MDGLVHQRATPVERPGSTPGTAVIIFLCAMPFDVGITHGQFAQAFLVDRFFEYLCGFVEPAGKDAGKDNFVFPAGLDHFVDLSNGFFDVFSVGLGHRLHDDRRVTANLDIPNPYRF